MNILKRSRLLPMRRQLAWAILSIFLALQLSGQVSQSRSVNGERPSFNNASRVGADSAPTVATEDLSRLKLTSGSMVNIRVFEEPDLDGAYRLDERGQITMPLAGSIQLVALTLPEAEIAVSAKLKSEDILKISHVSVNISEYSAQNIVVLGEVVAPGRYPVLGPRKLIDALAMAGGKTALSGDEIELRRPSQPTQAAEVIRYGHDVYDPNALEVLVNPGDTVVVRRAGIVYVLGAVNRPGGFPMQEAGKLNIAQAMALALGTAPDAALSSIRICRKLHDGSFAEFSAQYDKFKNGRGSPLALQAEDIVFVPSSKLKSAFIQTKTMLSAATSATIYTLR